MASQKKICRSNKAQITYWCQYMNSHPHFAAGDYKTPHGAAQLERQWAQLKAALDELGPAKTVEQWKVCWRDQKRKARVEGGALSHIINATGNQGDVPELSQNASLILSTIGDGMALGIGPEESPVGFSGRAEPPSPVLRSSRQHPPLPPRAPRSPVAGPSRENPAPLQNRAPARPQRARKIHPPDRFINAQLQMNSLLKVCYTHTPSSSF